MPDDTGRLQDQAKSSLVEKTLVALRSYTEDYHLEYARLLARGVALKDMPGELGKTSFGFRDPDIVEFHVDRFYAQAKGLQEHKDRAGIIAAALHVFDTAPKASPKVLDTSMDFAWQASATSKSKKDPPTKKPPSVDLAAPPTPPPPTPPVEAKPAPAEAKKPKPEKASADATLTTSSVEMPFVLPEGIHIPTDDELVARINHMAPGQRRQLSIVMQFPKPPSLSTVMEAFKMREASASSTLSTIMGVLGLQLPKYSGIDSEEWKQYRQQRMYALRNSPAILPAREPRTGKRGSLFP